MPRRKRIPTCRICGTTEGPISKQNKLCITCGNKRVKQSIDSLQIKSGPIYDKWKAGLAASLGLDQDEQKT